MIFSKYFVEGGSHVFIHVTIQFHSGIDLLLSTRWQISYGLLTCAQEYEGSDVELPVVEVADLIVAGVAVETVVEGLDARVIALAVPVVCLLNTVPT